MCQKLYPRENYTSISSRTERAGYCLHHENGKKSIKLWSKVLQTDKTKINIYSTRVMGTI